VKWQLRLKLANKPNIVLHLIVFNRDYNKQIIISALYKYWLHIEEFQKTANERARDCYHGIVKQCTAV